MIWVDNQSTSESVFSGIGTELRKEAKNNFIELQEKYKDHFPTGKLKYKLRKGKVYFEVAQQAKAMNADLIITGTHGITGYEEYWIGSNAYRIVTSAPCPVITIRQQYELRNVIKQIVLPIDNTKKTQQKVPVTVRLAKMFDAQIHLLALYSTRLKSIRNKVDSSSNHVKKILKQEGIKCVCESIFADNVTQATIEYTEKVNAELIAIMTEQETTASNILLGEYAQQMVYNSPVPVLLIHPA
jgi:nucleotide-binding universal stress UspA family protein